MKFGKLLTVTALATGVTFGAFVDSAEAARRRTKNTYSRRGTNESDIFSIYSLIDGINDTNSNDNVGFFPGAVEDYIFFGTDEFGNNTFRTADLDVSGSAGSPIFYNPQGLPINFLKCDPLLNYDSSNPDFPLVDENNNVSFKFDKQGKVLSPDCTEVVTDSDFTLKENADFQIIKQGTNIQYSVIDQETKETLEEFSILNTMNIDLDVNNLSDFIDLSKSNFRFNTEDSDFNINVLEATTTLTVPESNTSNSIIFLGFLGTGLLIKRRR